MAWLHFRKDRFPKLCKSKLMLRGAGPYKVLAKINDNAYKIELPMDEFGVSSFNVADLTPYTGDDLDASRSTPCQGGEDDADIPSPLPSFPIDDAAAQDKPNEVRIGPMTRARAKLLEQQVNSLLTEYDVCVNENFILPKSMHLCMIRFIDNTSIRGAMVCVDEDDKHEGGGGTIQDSDSIRTARSPEFETDVDS